MKNNDVKNNKIEECSDNKSLIVNTPKGKIIVSVKTDDLYPGIFIDFKSKDIKESAKIYSEDIPLAMIEYNTVEKELCTYIWGESGNEDITHKICYNDSLIFD